MPDRELILESLRAIEKEASPLREAASLGSYHLGGPESLWSAFGKRLEVLGGRIASLEDLAALDQPAFADEDALWLLPQSPELTDNVWEAQIGITLADMAVVETGSIVISATGGRSRLASLAPPLHIALVEVENIVATLDEAFAKLSPQNTVIITGTSRTADIEGVLVRGVHGPRELWVVQI